MLLTDGYFRALILCRKSRRGIWRLHYVFVLFLLLSVPQNYALSQSFSRYDKHVAIIERWLGQTEDKGANRSKLIDSMNRYVGNPYGSPYCAATPCFALKISGNAVFKTGLARNLRNKDTFTAWDVITGKRQIMKGDLLVWQKGETINGHAAVASENWNDASGETYEGNTSSGENGSQSNGNGFWARFRSISPTSYFRIKWITPLRA